MVQSIKRRLDQPLPNSLVFNPDHTSIKPAPCPYQINSSALREDIKNHICLLVHPYNVNYPTDLSLGFEHVAAEHITLLIFCNITEDFKVLGIMGHIEYSGKGKKEIHMIQ